MSNNFEPHIVLFIMWFIGCMFGWFIIPDMPVLGALVGGNSMITCWIFLEVYGRKH